MREKVKRTAMLLEIAANTPEHLAHFKRTLAAKGSAKTLYTQAHALGYHWDATARFWYTGVRSGNNHTPPKLNGKAPATETTQRIGVKQVSDKILIRVIAHKAVIERAAADLIELAEAMNMQVLSVSEPTQSEEADEFCKCYIRIKKQYATN